MMTPCDENPLQIKIRPPKEEIRNENESPYLFPNRSQSVGSSSVSSETPSWRASSSCRSISGYIENGSFSATSFDPTLSSNDEMDGAASMNNVFTYQELTQTNPDLGNHLVITVDRPEKVLATLDTFITFRVTTRARHTAFTHPEHQVRRRYSDFAWLRQRLESQFPFILLPALPEKHSVYSLDRFDPDFIKFRCMGLHLFMNWLVKHGSLTDHGDLHNFLRISDNDEWSAYRKTNILSPVSGAAPSPSLAQQCLSGDVLEAEFHAHNDYCSKLSQTLSSLEKMALKLLKSEQESSKDMETFQVVFNYWGESESSPSLKSAAASAATSLNINADCLNATSRRFEPQFVVPAHQFSLFSDSVRNVLRKRDNIETDYKNALDSLQKKQLEYDMLLKTVKPSTESSNSLKQLSNSSARNKDIDSKLNKLDQQIKELAKKVEKWNSLLKTANSDIQAELSQWHELKNFELRRLIATMASERVQMHRKCLSSWEEALHCATNDNPKE